MRFNRIQQIFWSLFFIAVLALIPLAAQNGNSQNGNNRNGDKNQPKGLGLGFDITNSRIMAPGRDRRDIMHGRALGLFHWPKAPKGMKLDWNYDVGGPVNSGPAKWNYLYGSETTGDPVNDRVYVAVNAVAGGGSPRFKQLVFHSEVTELTSNELRMMEADADVAETSVVSASIPANSTVQVSSKTWISSRGNPGAVTIPAGSWTFSFYANASTGGVDKAFFRVYKLDTAGTYTQIGPDSAQTGFLTTTRAQYSLTLTFGSSVTLSATDRLAFRLFATTGATANTTVTFYFENTAVTTADSYVTTNIPANNVYAFSDVYNTVGSPNQQPLCLWQTAIGNSTGKIDGSSVAFNWDGTRLFLGSTDGKVYCLNSTNGSVVWTYNTASSIVSSTPFFDAGLASLASETFDDLVWIGSTDGRLHKINANDGTGSKTTNPLSSSSTPAIHSTPIRYAFISGKDFVVVGTDDGFVYRVDTNNINTFVADSGGNTRYNLTDNGSTTAQDAIWATPIIDVSTNLMLLGVNQNFYKIDLQTGAQSTQVIGEGNEINYSSPMIDFTNNFAYVGGQVRLWKTPYPAWNALFSGVTAGNNPDATYPRSSPLWISSTSGSFVYIGDGGGFMNRFQANSSLSNPTLLGSFQLLPSATDSDSPVVMDYFTGNIYFGATNNRVYQLTQTF